MNDDFFTKKICDRCGCDLSGRRTMSWFTEEVICENCSKKEGEIKQSIRDKGGNVSNYEGCGYIPFSNREKN